MVSYGSRRVTNPNLVTGGKYRETTDLHHCRCYNSLLGNKMWAVSWE